MRIAISLLTTMLLIHSGGVRAADHRDSPLATNDPTADLNDIYTFVNPRNPSELIIAATVVPFANALSRFSDAVDYRVHIDNGQTEFVVTCRSPGSVRMECAGIPGLNAAGSVGRTINGTGGFRIYSGLRDDPFFFDLPAFNATRTAAAPRFTNPGTNAFAGNTLAIVLGIPSSAVNAGGARSVLKVYGSTRRTGGDGIGPGISGSWFDPTAIGAGFTVEVIPGSAGASRFNVVWNTYDTAGRQFWLFGTGTIDGRTAVVPMNFSSDGRFPPMRGDVRLQPFGNVTFEFDNCNTGRASYSTTVLNLPGGGTIPLTRLTTISGQTCEFLSRGQIDRNGRPAINPALINLLPATGTALKDAYNRAEGVASWAQFRGEMATNLAILDSLDGRTNAVLPPDPLSGVLVDDRLIIDVSKPICDEYLAVELGVPNRCGGRTLARDVIDDTLGATVGPGVTDGVANDSTFLSDWPFMNEPAN